MPESIQGQNGSAALMSAARAVCWGFGLGADIGCDILEEHFNPRCRPEWSPAELIRACRNAMQGGERPQGWLRDQDDGRPRQRRYSSNSNTDTPAAEAPPASRPGQPPTAPSSTPAQPTRPITIRNFAVRYREDGQEAGRNGMTPQQITREVLAATGGWPKSCNGRLFVPNADHEPVWLDDSCSLFSWLATHAGRAGGLIEWGRAEGMMPKQEYYAHLVNAVERYDDVQRFPHWPARPNTYYMHPDLPAGCSGAFDELLDQLRPATPTDRHLIRAFFLSLAWGGKLGGRPIFIFESAGEDGRPGQGAGKSTAAMLGGKLFGGYIGVSLATADDMQVQTRLLSEHGRRARLVVFDNLKGTRTSNSLIESYVTADVISGRELYVGEGTRPNIITWSITANQPSLSRDLVGRAYSVRIVPPVYSPVWNAAIDNLIANHRWNIIGDIVAELQAEPVNLLTAGEWSRWPEWEAEVLCKVCDPRLIRDTVTCRRDDMDDDAATADTVVAALAEFFRTEKCADAAQLHVEMTTALLASALGRICPHGNSPVHVGRWLSSMNIPGLTKRRTERARLWVWKGNDATADEPVEWDDIPRIPQ